MSENLVNYRLNDLTIFELRKENIRLSAKVLFQEQCIQILDNYRNYFILFCNNCKCDENVVNKLILKQLESDYKNVLSLSQNNSEKDAKNNNNIHINHVNNNAIIDEDLDRNEDNVMNSLVTVKTEDNLNENISLDVFPGNINSGFDKLLLNNTFIREEQSLRNTNQCNTTTNNNNQNFVFGSNLFTKKRKHFSKGPEVGKDPKNESNDQSMSQTTNNTSRTGRYIENLIHTYYDYNPETDRSVCKVITCGKEIRGKKPTNLQKHLSSHHKYEFKIYRKDEEMRKERKLKLDEQSLTIHTNTPTSIPVKKVDKYYDENSLIAKGFLLRLVKLVSITSMSVSIVKMKEFQELIYFLDKGIAIPSHLELKNERKKYLTNSTQEIVDKIQNSDYITLVSDIIRCEEMSKFFIRVTAYLYDKSNKVKNVFTLGFRPFPKPHKAEHIIQTIEHFIQEYNISYDKIICVMTDNGSDLCHNFKAKILVDNRNECETDEEVFDETEFHKQELDLNLQFQKLNIPRVDSVIHIIVCAIKTCEKKCSFQTVIKKVAKLLRKICQFMNLTTNLLLDLDINQTIIPTNWNLKYQQLRCFYHKRREIESICLENNFQCFESEEWKSIEELIDLYKPFDEITIDLSKENETTISKIVSSYLFLKHQLLIKSQNESGSEALKSMTTLLTVELEKRFNRILDPNNEHFNDGIYLASTLLDPRFGRMLSDRQLKCAKLFLREFYKRIGDKEPQIIESIESSKEESTEEQKSSFESFMETELSRMSSKTVNKMLNFDKQLFDWFHFISGKRISLSTDPLEFWQNDSSTHHYLDLKNIALNLLCIPSTTTTNERLFNTLINNSIDPKHSLSEKLLERIIFFKSNAKYLKTLNFFE